MVIEMRVRLILCLVLVVVVGLGLSGAASGASFPWIWRNAGSLARGEGLELACPSGQLCVAVDGHGQVMRSTDPAAGVSSWSATQIPGAPTFTSLACASNSVCVAGDSAGRIWTFNDPSAGVEAATGFTLEPGTRVAAIVCPSASVCVAAAGEDLLVSTDPTAAGSWQIYKGIDNYLDYQCVKYQGTDCAVPLSSVSCSSSSYCLAIDDEGGAVGGDPMTGFLPGPEQVDAGVVIDGAACMPGGQCMTECGEAEGIGWDQCPGGTYAGTDLCDTTLSCYQLSSGQLYELTCPRRLVCFTGGPSGNLLASPDPAAGAKTWRTVLSETPGADAPRPIQQIACPTADLCVASDSQGELVQGAPPPTAVNLRRLLARQITIPHRHATIRSLLEHDDFTYSISSPTSARLKIHWTSQHAHRPAIVIASGTATFRASQTRRVRMRITLAGRSLLTSRPQRVSVVATANLDGTIPRSIHVTRTLAITR